MRSRSPPWCVALLLRTSTLATADLHGWHWVALLAGLWCGARAAMAVIVTSVPYARAEGGLATAFAGGRWWAAAPGVGLAVVAVGAGAGGRGLLGLAIGALGGRRRRRARPPAARRLHR